MSGERQALENPLWVDFSGRPVPPLAFLLQPECSPKGVVERSSDGVTISHSPWYSEICLELRDVAAVAQLYLMPRTDTFTLLMACLDEAIEPFFRTLTGADFGDSLTKLTASHWPDEYALLLRSNDRAHRGRLLCNVATPGRMQWVVAEHLRQAQLDQISIEQILDLVGCSLQTFVRMSNFAFELPGALEVLGGPDRMDRRLSAVAGLLGATAGIGGALQGGLRTEELLDLGRAAQAAVESMIRLRDS